MTNNKKAQSLTRDEFRKVAEVAIINHIESNIKYWEGEKKYYKNKEEGWEDKVKTCEKKRMEQIEEDLENECKKISNRLRYPHFILTLK